MMSTLGGKLKRRQTTWKNQQLNPALHGDD